MALRVKLNTLKPMLDALGDQKEDAISFVADAIAAEGEQILMGGGTSGTVPGNYMRSGTRQKGAIPVDTGHLANVALHIESPAYNKRTWVVNAPYAQVVHDGNPDFDITITPTKAKALHWIGPNGEDIFRKKTFIKAGRLRPQPFFTEMIEILDSYVDKVAAAALFQWMKNNGVAR